MPEPAPASEARTGFKILLVDDDAKNLVAIESILEGMGHVLVRARSGRDALRRLMEDDFAVILMDVRMPDLDGFETARLIRARERTRHVPIVFLTGVGRSENEMFSGYEAGAVDYLLKPFPPQVLRHKVQVLVDLQKRTLDVTLLNAELRNSAGELKEANRSLKELNATLEDRVLERTAELKARERDLARSNEELSQFASVVSHDLHEPLRTAENYLTMLARESGPALGPRAQGFLGQAQDAARRMRRLISDLLAFSRVDASCQEPAEVDLNELLRDVLGKLDGAIAASGARMTVNPLPVVRGLSAPLGQLFQNLLDNAIKFCGKKRPRVEVGCGRSGGESRFWVKDNGQGIAAANFERVFLLFKRLPNSAEILGSGLGLALCRKIVEQHGGRIWVESKLGKGCVFHFTLEAADTPAASASEPAQKALPPPL